MPRYFSAKDISVVLPTYNSDKTIVPLLESIFAQNPPPGEIIVIDDCSTDETVNFVKKYPVRLIQQEQNGGPAKARNKGVKEAKGEIILFLDSDTYLMPKAIQALLDGFNNNGYICAQNGCCHPEPLNRGWFPLYKGLVESSWTDDVPDWSDGSKCINARIGAFTRSSLLDIGGFDESYPGASVEDHELGIRYSKKYKIFLNKRLVVRHHFPNFQQTVRNYWRRTYETMELLQNNKEVLDTGGVSKKSGAQYVVGSTLIILPSFFIFSTVIWFLWFLLFIIFVFLSRSVLKKLFSKGLLFGLFGTVTHAIYGLVITSAVTFFYINLLLLRRNKNGRALYFL